MKPRLLLVDEDTTLRRCLARRLLVAGFEVEVVGTVALAREVVHARPPALVILNGAGGLERNGVPLLLLVERGAPGAASADAYLSKPFTVEELLARIRTLINVESGRG